MILDDPVLHSNPRRYTPLHPASDGVCICIPHPWRYDDFHFIVLYHPTNNATVCALLVDIHSDGSLHMPRPDSSVFRER